MTEQKKPGLDLPPPHERRIIAPGAPGIQMIRPNPGTPPPRPGPPGMPQPGPAGMPIQRVAASSRPLTVAMTFAPPPGMEHVPPNGVFWIHNGGVLMSQVIGPPAILDAVQKVTEDGEVLEDVAVGPDSAPVGEPDGGPGDSDDGAGANEEGGDQAAAPSEEPETE